MRSLTILLVLFVVAPVFGQNGDRFFQVETPLDIFTIRPVMEAVRDLDPNGKVLYSDDMTILQIKVNPSVTDAELRQVITNTGVLLAEGTLQIDTPPVYTTPDGKPLYVLSNDEAGDRASYEAAVREWNDV